MPKEGTPRLEKLASRGRLRHSHHELGLIRVRSLIELAMTLLDLEERDLGALKKVTSAERKLLIAWLVKQRTTVSNRWLSSRLRLGHYTNASNAVRRIEDTKSRRLKALRNELKKLYEYRSDPVDQRKWYDKSVDYTAKEGPTHESLSRFRKEAAELLGVTE